MMIARIQPHTDGYDISTCPSCDHSESLDVKFNKGSSTRNVTSSRCKELRMSMLSPTDCREFAAELSPIFGDGLIGQAAAIVG
jgi:hypothetical protein